MDWSALWSSSNTLFAVEALLVIALLAFRLRFARFEKALGGVARHRYAPAAAGALAMLLRAAALPVAPIPHPSVSDEFSYLLGADTFAHGRIANPPHPMWEHFETFHVDQLPTYGSMYPPLPALVMGTAQAVTGIPFVGVWLSCGLMCAALCWGLRGWFPPGWAFCGAAIAAVRLAMFSYWDDSYWGGALAATGGALVFGALPRLIRRSRPRDAALAALGIAMLANTRPYEGLVFTLAAGLVALASIRRLRLRTILPAMCAVLAVTAALMGYYNWRAFGSPTTLPYTINRATYAVAPYFLFQKMRPEPMYRNQRMREFYTGWEVQAYQVGRTKRGFLNICLNKLYTIWSFFLGPVLTLPLLAAAATWRGRRTRILLFMAACVAVASALVPFFVPHYVAPATVLIYALVVQGLRSMRRSAPRIVYAVPVVCALMVAVRVGMAAASIPLEADWPMTWARPWPGPLDREDFVAQMQSAGGEHVVIVRYAVNKGSNYVFNGADIDHSPIVWAQDMGAEKNAELLRYFSSRKAWVLDVRVDPPVLSPYTDVR